MPVKEVTEQTFASEILDSQLPVLIEFGAEWCGPCKVVAPELEALAHELKGKAKIVTIDIDRSPVLAREFGVQSVPAFVVLHQRRPVAARAGAMRRKELRELLEPVLPRAAGALRPQELAELLKRGGVTPVDLRDAASYGRAHLPQSVNLPLGEVESRLAELHMLPGEPIVYCRSGVDSQELAQRLASQGMPVGFLEGGLLDWEANGLPIEKG